MRKLIVLTLALGLLTLVNSCSKSNQHLNTIPSTSQFVGSIDLFNLAQKAELYNLEQYTFYNKMMKEIEANNSEMHKFIKDIASNPLKTGLKYREDLYFFAENIDKNPTIGVTMSLRNSKDFKKTVTEALEKTKAEMTLTEVDGFNQLANNDFVMLFNNDKVLFVMNNKMKDAELLSYTKSLMKQGSDESVAIHSDFAKFKSNKKDFNLWTNSDFLAQSSEFKMIASQFPFSTAGNYIHTHLSFDDNEIIGKSSTTYNEDIQALLKKYNFLKDQFNTDVLKYLPAENYITYGFAINPSEIYKWLEDTPNYKLMLDQVNQGAPITIEKMMTSLGGDIIFALHGFKFPPASDTIETNKPNVLPLATAILSMNNDELYKIITNQIPKDFFELTDAGYYKGSVMDFNLFFGLFNNNLIVTNDENIVTNAAKSGLNQNLGNSDLKDMFSKTAFGYLNFKLEEYPEELKSMIESMMDHQLGTINSETNILKDIRFYNENNTNGIFKVNMQNIEKNSLYTILKTIDKHTKM